MTPACDDAQASTLPGNAPAEIAIRPAPTAWLARPSPTPDSAAAAFRRELGLSPDRPVIMSGHQAQLWHPGILAKLIALNAAASRLDAQPAWVIVDHDENHPLNIRAPIIGADGRLAVAGFGPPASPDGVPACRQPSWSPPAPFSLPPGSREAAPGVQAGLGRIHNALARHAAQPNAALQAAHAANDLCNDHGVQPPPLILATGLARTSLFRELVAQMQADPAACIDAHNAAVSAFPHERIAPLALEADRAELPLWQIDAAPASPRRRVFTTDLAAASPDSLAPRALLLTGLMRLAGCELFIHGLGGERYDRITDLWLKRWLGRTPAPTAMVTATLRLPIPGCWPSDQSIARAAWTSHHARHNPALLADAPRSAEKARLLDQLRSTPRKTRERAELYRRLHTLLDAARREHADQLRRLDADAAAMKARSAEALIAHDRTWPFPLYQPDQTAALRVAIDAQFR